MSYLEGFVLGFQDTGEYDRRFSLLSEKQGKMTAVCKSILKPRAKLAGHLDFPNLVWLELVWSIRGWQITQALEKLSYPALRQNAVSLRASLKAAEFLREMLFSQSEAGNRDRNYIYYLDNLQGDSDLAAQHKQIFSLWQEFLSQLEFYAGQAQEPKADAEFLSSQLVLKVLQVLGFVPDIFTCANCGQTLKRLNSNPPAQAGKVGYYENQFFCENCAVKLRLPAQELYVSSLVLASQVLKGVWLPDSSFKNEVIEISRLFKNQSHLSMV